MAVDEVEVKLVLLDALALLRVTLALLLPLVLLPIVLLAIVVRTPMQIYCMVTEGSASDPVDVEKSASPRLLGGAGCGEGAQSGEDAASFKEGGGDGGSEFITLKICNSNTKKKMLFFDALMWLSQGL